MRKIKKVKWTFRIILISIVGIIVIQKIINNSRFKAYYDKPVNRKEAWIQDLNHFQNNFYKVCKSFPSDSIIYSNRIIDSIKQNIDSLSDSKIQLLISKCVSMADDGHTSMHFGNYRRIPLRLYLFDDGLYVIKAKKGYEKYLGYKVNRICDKPINDLIKLVDYYVSGNQSWITYKSSYLLTSPDFFEAANVSNTSDSIRYEFVSDLDTIIKYIAVIENVDWSDEYDSWRDLAPSNKTIMDTTGWRHILTNDNNIPLYLSQPNIPGFVEYIDSLNTLYIQINTSTSIKGLIKTVVNSNNSQNVQNLIVDLRFNGGGNYMQLASFTKIIPKIFKGNGKIYIITGTGTFSAGICIAARLKYYSKDKAIIVGQTMGDELHFWAEGKQFYLPNSKIRARAANGLHDWENNKYVPFKTFWLNILFGVPAKDLTPDIFVDQNFKDYISRADKIMIEIKQHLHNSKYK